MSKEIDISNGVEGLSEDDLLYLAARDNQEAAAELQRREISIDQSQATPIDQVANTGDANTSGESIAELEARLERMKAEQASEEDDEEEDEGLEPPYDAEGITNDDLRSEIVRRNEGRAEEDKLSLEGRKADLIQTLVDDDESDEDTE